MEQVKRELHDKLLWLTEQATVQTAMAMIQKADVEYVQSTMDAVTAILLSEMNANRHNGKDFMDEFLTVLHTTNLALRWTMYCMEKEELKEFIKNLNLEDTANE